VSHDVPVLLLNGTVGSGKTTLAWEISDVLSACEVPHAALDGDGFRASWPVTSRWNEDLLFESIAAVWPVQRAHGAERLVIAMVVEDPTDLDRYRAAIPGADITVCRLVAPDDTYRRRITNRMPAGPSRDWHLHRTTELHDILERAGIDDFVVVNDGAIREVALEVLRRAGWV
jgi:adenylylsulfate kinase